MNYNEYCPCHSLKLLKSAYILIVQFEIFQFLNKNKNYRMLSKNRKNYEISIIYSHVPIIIIFYACIELWFYTARINIP